MSDTGRNGFKDHFSGHAGDYARHRPVYPPELFDWLARTCAGTRQAWDVGTGNGQAALGLASHFDSVLATDASAQQLARASGPDNVIFRVEQAEQCSLPGASTDLVTVGQALHWFDFEPFFKEVRRVLRPSGMFAAWTYLLNRVTPEIDQVVHRLYDDIAGAYWPPERRLVEGGYADIPLPFQMIEVPEFTMRTQANLSQYRDYIGTWSAVQRYLIDQSSDPRLQIDEDLASAWGDPGHVRTVDWPLVIRAGFSRSES